MYYSKSTGGFYHPAIHGKNIPDDAVEISMEYYAELTSSKVIVADASGYPSAIDPPQPVRTKESLLSEVAAKRWIVETGGILSGGTPIATDRESQAQLASVYATLKSGLIIDTPWKAADGSFTHVTLAEIEPFFQAVAQHVRNCFAAELAHKESIVALTTQAELDAYDLSTGWPVGR
ncbi:DUF4376 domain-containing protein [Aeromonas veronii]|uniref:DUF4376 domain-containing protein n=1 Tax=Aeromonas veronii TaxID=654 RepID=UPI00191EB3BF|nr:DUF4376 domain-containing protein [Aeromonas veronii]MBL0629503.1 DUF4376 domain-containing protein [Aeromonas veronii]